MKKRPVRVLLIIIISVMLAWSVLSWINYQRDQRLLIDIATHLGYNKENHLVILHSASFYYDNIELLFTATEQLEQFRHRIDYLGLETISFVDRQPRQEFPRRFEAKQITDHLLLHDYGSDSGIATFTEWSLKTWSGKVARVKYIDLSGQQSEWFFNGKPVGQQVVLLQLDRLSGQKSIGDYLNIVGK